MRVLAIEDDSTPQSIERALKSERVTAMPGERFSALYVRPADPTPDSSRARHRVGVLFRETVFNNHTEQLARYLGQELGIPVPGDGRLSSDWQQFMRECRTPEFLDTVTLVYRCLFYHASGETANQWRDVVKKIFAEENLAYEIDEVGGVHPAIDREFQRNSASAVAGLDSDRYDNVRELFEQASNHLGAVLEPSGGGPIELGGQPIFVSSDIRIALSGRYMRISFPASSGDVPIDVEIDGAALLTLSR